MRKFLCHYKNKNESKINKKLIERAYDKDLVECVVNVFKSLESTGMIKFLDYSVERDESKIDYSKYITSRKKKKKKDANIKYHFIKANRVFELTMRFRVDVNGEFQYVTRSILLPKKDKNNYLMLKGKRYFLLYQLVDSSTYVTKEGVTFKSLMPIAIHFRKVKITDLNGVEYSFTSFFIKVFKREISVLLFYLAKIGWKSTLQYFMVDRIMELIATEDANPDDEKYIFFPANRHLVLRVERGFFERFDYVKAITRMLLECFAPKTSFQNIENYRYWIEMLGSLYTKSQHKMIESGRSTIVFFERLLDLTSKDALKVSEINKMTVYSVIRWMISNYPALRQKNNLDLTNKRLRLNEYVASLLSLRIGESVNRVLTYGNKINLKQVVTNVFSFSGSIVIQALQTSQLLKYEDLTNDLDVFSGLKYTIKGPRVIGFRMGDHTVRKVLNCWKPSSRQSATKPVLYRKAQRLDLRIVETSVSKQHPSRKR